MSIKLNISVFKVLHFVCIEVYTCDMDQKSNEVIDALGGTVVVAGLCNVTKGAVSQWRENGIPEARLMYLKLLRPDVFGAETEQKAA